MNIIDKRKKKNVPCFYYNEYDDDIEYCKHTAIMDTWFCKKHQESQPLYSRLYKCKCLHDYLKDTNLKNKTIDSIILHHDIK